MEFIFTCIRDVTFGVPQTARDGQFSIELYGNIIYTAYDRAPLPRIGDSPNGLHTDLKFQNQAIQCCIRLHDYALLMRFARILAQDIGELVGSSLE